MKNLLILISLIISICSYSILDENNESFSLKGISINLDDGTQVELFDVLSNLTLDSAIVNNNEFEFKGKLENNPSPVFVIAKESNQYRWLWLENKSMIIDGAGSDLENSKVIGSQVQDTAVELFEEMDSSPENSEEIAIKFVLENPNSIISASMLSDYSKSWGKPKVEELFKQLSKNNQESVFGAEVKKFIEYNRIIQIGDKYVDFEMNNAGQESIRLSENLGKITLLEFWASNCGPCRMENPNLVKTYNRYNKLGFEIFAVSLDREEDDWHKAIEKDNLPWTHVSDLNKLNKASLIYGISMIPNNYLINENGNIIGKNLRGEELNFELEKLLN